MGPPGSGRKETALALSEHFSWGCISIGDLLKKEVSKKSEYGKAITESLKSYRYGIYLLYQAKLINILNLNSGGQYCD